MPSLLCFLITIRGGLEWVKAPLTYTTFCVMCPFTWPAYLPVKSCITVTIPASFLQFPTFLYAHKTCQELLDVHKATYHWVSHLSFSWIFNDTWTRSPSLSKLWKFMHVAPPSVLLVRKSFELFQRQSGYSEYRQRSNWSNGNHPQFLCIQINMACW